MGLLKVLEGGRLPLFGGTVATRKWSPFRSPAFGRVSTIAARHHQPLAALAMLAIWAGTFHAIGRL